MIPITPSNPERLALIGYSSKLTSSTLAPEMLTPNTYERYTPGTGAVVAKFELGASSDIDFIAIGAHNIGTHDGGTEITVSYATTVGGALTEIESITPTDNGALFFSFDSVTAAQIAIETNATTSGQEIGVIYTGEALQMQQPIYGGHSPIELSQNTTYSSSMSESGQFLGRTITRKGLETSFSWRHLDHEWYRSDFQPFAQSARTLPFFIQWRPDVTSAAAFGYTTGDIKPTNMGGGSKLMSVDLTMRAHSDV